MGEHEVISPPDATEFSHKAYSRVVAVSGAITAAKFLAGVTEPGMDAMNDALRKSSAAEKASFYKSLTFQALHDKLAWLLERLVSEAFASTPERDPREAGAKIKHAIIETGGKQYRAEGDNIYREVNPKP